MLFKRSSTSYGQSPYPETPYQKAGQVWDERIGSARVQAKNWRLMALGSLALSFATSGALVWRSLQSTVTPYVVEIDETGAARAVAPAMERYTPSDAQIAHHLANFISDVRGLSVDPVVVRQNWLSAYDFVTDRGAIALNDYAQANDPFADIGRKSRTVEIVSVVRVSDDSFQARWIEKSFENGALMKSERFTGLFTIVTQPPRDAATLRANPLGLYVHELHWGQDLVTGD
ncbi:MULTISPECIES: conjugal transfer protein TrbF [Hyphomonas]|uniref:Conjugal transfer protein TrbF n=1 Tax=Hyphomonas adhaerens TaxID=81029 RepID=A0A3B9GWF6_9PROT|nr:MULTISPECIES: conjugal transfer protein TrbF [Hyphomonas]MBB41624.1 conjugal transfer protein TrbF [Hyphomonas sp.]HAE26761.1 conjugal transfer protein TrbF [Hyphomonas adhaerens]|tara:strand:- start:739 stop:1431 length:693 start_codon:yes stop_codon:yes gene_type:complete